MDISVSEAKGQLTDLIRRAEDGEEVVLTRHGRPVVRLIPVEAKLVAPVQRRALMESLRRTASIKAQAGAEAARSQDHLYDSRGMPL